MRRLGGSREWIGASLAHTVLLGERAFRREPVSTIDVVWDELDEQTRVAVTASGTEERLATAATDYEALRADDTASTQALATAREEFEEALHLAYKARRWPGNGYVVRIQFLRLGRITLVALPFEVLAQLALQMKSAAADSVLVSCANGYEGYLPFQEDFERGGYEAQFGSAHFTAGSAERIRDRIIGRLQSWRQQ